MYIVDSQKMKLATLVWDGLYDKLSNIPYDLV